MLHGLCHLPRKKPCMPALRPLNALSTWVACTAAASLLLGAGLAQAQASRPASAAADTGFSAGLAVQPRTTFEKLALPGYPGAVLDTERSDGGDKVEHGAASVGVNFGFFGVQVDAMKLRSTEAPAAVTAWYREQLARLGPVLDCSADGPPDAPPLADAKADKQVLRCGKDRAQPGKALFKLGTRQQQRVVAIEARAAGGTRISLVRVDTRGAD